METDNEAAISLLGYLSYPVTFSHEKLWEGRNLVYETTFRRRGNVNARGIILYLQMSRDITVAADRRNIRRKTTTAASASDLERSGRVTIARDARCKEEQP